ncbi:hypothetical protein QJS66_03690 [Kocuria rhizophila]|nr:hypothetical protein QJS66_03690 [Kocuria rhizophila]
MLAASAVPDPAVGGVFSVVVAVTWCSWRRRRRAGIKAEPWRYQYRANTDLYDRFTGHRGDPLFRLRWWADAAPGARVATRPPTSPVESRRVTALGHETARIGEHRPLAERGGAVE